MRKYAKEKKAIQDNVSNFLLSAVSIAVIALVVFRFVNDISAQKIEFVIKKNNDFTLQSSSLCKPMNNTDIAADGLASAVTPGDVFLQPTSEACCNACIMHAGSPNRCNIWVWNPETKACWLKYVNRKPETPKGMYKSPNTPWTSGAIYAYPEHFEDTNGQETCIHTVLTSNGNQYAGWQTKVFYETYKNIARGNKLMKKFTRILHSNKDDDLMNYIPTQRVEPEVNYPAFVIAERSNALMRWVQNQPKNTCSHLLFVESDYLFFRQPPELALPASGNAIGFHFGYVNPTYPTVEPIVRKYFDKPELIPQTGIAPLLITFDDFKNIAPIWSSLQASFEQDEEVVKELGWVRDMYSFSIAAAKAGVNILTEYVPYNTLMCQPPADYEAGKSFIFHYTWCVPCQQCSMARTDLMHAFRAPAVYVHRSPEINIDGKEIWRFDKRSYEARLLSKLGNIGTLALNPPIPPYNPKMRLQDNVTVTRKGYKLIKQMVLTFNEAVMAYNSN